MAAAAAAAVQKVRGPTCRSRAQAEPAARLAQAPRASRLQLATAALNHTPKPLTSQPEGAPLALKSPSWLGALGARQASRCTKGAALRPPFRCTANALQTWPLLAMPE